jgi:hypothetical protein
MAATKICCRVGSRDRSDTGDAAALAGWHAARGNSCCGISLMPLSIEKNRISRFSRSHTAIGNPDIGKIVSERGDAARYTWAAGRAPVPTWTLQLQI